MKKRYSIFLFLTVFVFLACVSPALVARLSAENRNTAFSVGLNLNSLQKQFGDEDCLAVLEQYKASGVTAAVICEEALVFDGDLIALGKKSNLPLALIVDGTTEKNPAFYEMLEKTLKEQDVRFVGVKNRDKEKQIPVSLANVLKEKDVTFIVMEKMSQLSNERFIGYDEAISASGGRIMRSYETWEEPARTISAGTSPVDYADVLYHQMVNSAKDRNTRFILVNQVISGTENPYEQAEQTQIAIERFSKDMASSGYDSKAVPDYSGYAVNRRLASAGAVFIGIMMALFMLHVVFKLSSAALDYICFLLGVGAFGITFLLPESLMLMYPTVYAVVGACFSFTACAFLGKGLADRQLSSFSYTICMLAVALGVLVASGSVLLALLSGADYYINNLVFRGVKLTLLAPIAFAAGMLFLFYSDKSVKEQLLSLPKTIKDAIAKIRIYHVLLVLLVGVAGVLYLMRSGNSGISLWENQFRNFLSDISGARPRTKEFLIGWPCFVLWMYYMRKDSVILKWIFGVGASLLFASVTNTFCHVFTDGGISLMRTVNGMVASLPVVLVVVAGNFLVLQLAKRIHKSK